MPKIKPTQIDLGQFGPNSGPIRPKSKPDQILAAISRAIASVLLYFERYPASSCPLMCVCVCIWIGFLSCSLGIPPPRCQQRTAARHCADASGPGACVLARCVGRCALRLLLHASGSAGAGVSASAVLVRFEGARVQRDGGLPRCRAPRGPAPIRWPLVGRARARSFPLVFRQLHVLGRVRGD